MENSLKNGTKNALSGGLAGSVVDLKKLRAEWQRQYINGETQLQFKDWAKGQGNLSAMPR